MELPDLKDLDLTFKSEADPRILSFQDKLGKALNTIYKAISKPIDLPKIFQVTGKVSVSKIEEMPAVTISNFTQLADYFKGIEARIGHLATAISLARGAKIEIPKIEIPKIQIPDNKELRDSLDKIEKALKTLASKESEFPTTISVDNFPPTMTPTPVTNININSLRGFVKTTAQTLTTSLQTIPSYGVLGDRRSMMLYNNSSTVTIFIGGSDVTATNGMPVPPLSYSPSFDAGPTMIIYGLTSSSTADIRVTELSNNSGG